MIQKTILVALPALALAACAVETRAPQGFNFEHPADYIAWQAEIESELANGNPRELDENEWQKFRELRSKSQNILAGYETMASLSENDRMAIYNVHQEMTLLVVEDEGPPAVFCRWEHVTGSHMRVRRCIQRAPSGTADAQRTYLEETMRRHDRIVVPDMPSG